MLMIFFFFVLLPSLASSLVAGPPPGGRRRSALFAAKVLVCGPTQFGERQTVADAVEAELTRQLGEAPARWDGSSSLFPADAYDAAVLCADPNTPEKKRGNLASLVATFAEKCSSSTQEQGSSMPGRVVVVVAAAAQAGQSSSKGGGTLLTSLFGGKTDDDDAVSFDAEALAFARSVTVVRHGELFGGDGSPAFKDGLKVAPVLSEDISRRGARVSSVRAPRAAGGERETSFAAVPPTRRSSLARVAAEAALAFFERGSEGGGVAEIQVASLVGVDEPTKWPEIVAEALEASDVRSALRLTTAAEIDPAKLERWVFSQWGPRALRANSATYATAGARPVRFSKLDGKIAQLKYEDFDGKTVNENAGSLVVAYDPATRLLTVTRDRDDLLPGEVALVDNLADAVDQAFPAPKEPPKEPPKDPAVASVVVADEEEEKMQEELPPTAPEEESGVSLEAIVKEEPAKAEPTTEQVVAKKPKKRRSAIRARTKSATPPANKGGDDSPSS